MPVPSGPETTPPDWTPTLVEVADYVPGRTIPINRQADGEPLGTFTTETRPTAESAQRRIADAVAWVLTRVPEPHVDLHAAANHAATLWAAGWVEMTSEPRKGVEDRTYARELLEWADKEREKLAARNESLTGTDPDDPDASAPLLPYWSFPAATELPI